MEGVALFPALREHNEAIRDIYNKEVRAGLGTLDIEPRTAMEQGQWLAEHDDRWPAFVAVSDGEVVGFGALSRYHLHPGYRHTVEDSIYIEESFRERGIATLLLHRLLGAAIDRNYHSVMARIVAGQQSALSLHESFGFQQVACEREVGRKFEQWLDVNVLQLVLPSNSTLAHSDSSAAGEALATSHRPLLGCSPFASLKQMARRQPANALDSNCNDNRLGRAVPRNAQ